MSVSVPPAPRACEAVEFVSRIDSLRRVLEPAPIEKMSERFVLLPLTITLSALGGLCLLASFGMRWMSTTHSALAMFSGIGGA